MAKIFHCFQTSNEIQAWVRVNIHISIVSVDLIVGLFVDYRLQAHQSSQHE